MSVARLWLARVIPGRVAFPRGPFFRARLSPGGAHVAARAEENERGNLPVSADAASPAHWPEVGQ
jgi:hypothetical protein